MRVLTWNLWWRNGPWEDRRKAIAATLAQVSPDVCGLQEVWGTPTENLAAELAAELGMHWCWSWLPTPDHWTQGGDVAIGNAVLSRWPILEQIERPLPAAEGEEQRVALHARIAAPGGVLPFFTTHFTARLGGSAARTAQVCGLVEFVADYLADTAYPPVVTGAFNAEPDSDELRLLGGLLTPPAVPGLVLVDAWRYAAPGDPGFTWDRRNGYLADSIYPDSRIDYIMVGLPIEGRGQVRAAWLEGLQPVAGVWPSDHFAVVAELQD